MAIKTGYPPQFENYVKLVTEDDLITAFQNQQPVIDDFFASIVTDKADYAYAPGKWTLKEMLQHIIDAERIFSYRALCFARGETLSLPGFEENDYAANSFANNRNWFDLCKEMKVVRESTLLLFNSFLPDILDRQGIANNNPVTVSALGFIMVGHLYHHKNIIEERYLPEVPL